MNLLLHMKLKMNIRQAKKRELKGVRPPIFRVNGSSGPQKGNPAKMRRFASGKLILCALVCELLPRGIKAVALSSFARARPKLENPLAQ